MIKLVRYSIDQIDLWNSFIESSKNGVFLFNRNYMDYHSNRFKDNSIIVLDNCDKPLALFPANRKDDMIVSHGGLTFGGFIVDFDMRTQLMMEIMEKLLRQFKTEGIKKVTYKAIPHIYHKIPAEEDLYALFRYDARLVRRDVSSTILMSRKLQYPDGRRRSIKKAHSTNIKIIRSNDFKAFMRIVEETLRERHNTKPVHTADEICLLAERFPENIMLFSADRDGEMMGGVIVYNSRNVAHLQYIAATEEGMKICATDAVIDYLITEFYKDKRYFDFGISTEDEGRYLNIGLSEYKSSYGARATVYDTYEIILQEK